MEQSHYTCNSSEGSTQTGQLVPTMTMPPWSNEIEEELALLIKDWLKQHRRTQADLRKDLQADSTRMPALMEVLKKEYSLGGLPKVAYRLCAIEKAWTNNQQDEKDTPPQPSSDPFGQLDLLLQEIREDCESEIP